MGNARDKQYGWYAGQEGYGGGKPGSGCASGSQVYADSDKTATVTQGREFTIVLDSNPTTGYNWVESYDEAFLKLISSEYKAGEAAGKVGSGGTQYFRFKALKTGETQVTFNYQRPWEQEPVNTEVFTVTIK